MNLATEQFKLPFESGEPIIKKICRFSFRKTYDKVYVLKTDDYLARGEVIEQALKNEYFIKTKQTRDLSGFDQSVYYEKTDYILEKIPECFGVFMGEFIPIAAGCHTATPWEWEKITKPELMDVARIWQNQFFEHFAHFWCLIMLNQEYPHDKIKALGNKPVWVKIGAEDMAVLWFERYQYLKTKGISCPAYEQTLSPLYANKILAKISPK